MDKQKLILEELRGVENINESSLGRLYQHIGKDYIVFITSDRQQLDVTENNKRRKELEKYIRLAGFGYNKVVGNYVEEETGEPKKEKSFVVYGKDEEEMLKMFKRLGEKYEQDSILFVDLEGNAYLLYTYGSKKGTSDKLGNFHVGIVGDFYSTIGKKAFRFEVSESYYKERFTTFSGMLHENFMKFVNKYDDFDIRWENR